MNRRVSTDSGRLNLPKGTPRIFLGVFSWVGTVGKSPFPAVTRVVIGVPAILGTGNNFSPIPPFIYIYIYPFFYFFYYLYRKVVPSVPKIKQTLMGSGFEGEQHTSICYSHPVPTTAICSQPPPPRHHPQHEKWEATSFDGHLPYVYCSHPARS